MKIAHIRNAPEQDFEAVFDLPQQIIFSFWCLAVFNLSFEVISRLKLRYSLLALAFMGHNSSIYFVIGLS